MSISIEENVNKNNFSLEIIIPSYNRLSILEQTLKKIRILYPDTPICIGFQGDFPEGEFLQWLDADPNLRWLQREIPSTTNTLNECIESSKADIVLVTDDDAIPSFGWLKSHLEAFREDPELAYTCGREIRVNKGNTAVSEFIRISVQLLVGLFFSKKKKSNGYIIGWMTRLGLMFGNFNQPGSCEINSPRACNLAIRRDVFQKLGGFNPTFKGNSYLFEADFGLRMAEMGKLGKYLGDAIVNHLEVSGGGSRQRSRKKWFDDFFHNNTIIIKRLGLLAWIGSMPRLVKFYIRMTMTR